MTAAPSAARVVAIVTLPYLPAALLSKNGRDRAINVLHPSGKRFYKSARADAFRDLKHDAAMQLRNTLLGEEPRYPALVMHTTWYAIAPLPDDDNVAQRVAAVRDAAENVGLVANDRHIVTAVPTIIRVQHRHEQRVVIVFETKGD